jgi:acetyl-CoA acetyltransferase family protein
MGISGDAIAKKYGFSREVVDKFAFESQMKAAKAMYDGKFDEEIVQLHTSSGIVLRDESIRPNTSLSGLSKLKPAFGSDGIHTAGSSSQISAGAAALLLAGESAVKKHKLKPIARLVASSVVATDSQKAEEQLIGPKSAIKKVLEKAGLKIEDIDLFEINEAFASVVVATIQECKINPEKVNVNGGAIALGHPLGVSGARLPVTLLHEMQRRAKEGKPSKYGLVTLCIGGGQAIAIIFEKV